MVEFCRFEVVEEVTRRAVRNGVRSLGLCAEFCAASAVVACHAKVRFHIVILRQVNLIHFIARAFAVVETHLFDESHSG